MTLELVSQIFVSCVKHPNFNLYLNGFYMALKGFSSLRMRRKVLDNGTMCTTEPLRSLLHRLVPNRTETNIHICLFPGLWVYQSWSRVTCSSHRNSPCDYCMVIRDLNTLVFLVSMDNLLYITSFKPHMYALRTYLYSLDVKNCTACSLHSYVRLWLLTTRE